jgi:Tfp pilus assembly protein PilF
MRFALPLALLALSLPAHAATAPKSKPVAKAAAPVIEPQPDATSLINQAHDAQGRGQSDLALRLAQAAIVADPARPSSYDALADLYLALSQPEAARSYYGEALSIDPNDDGAMRGMSALDHGAPQQAAQQAVEAQGQGAKTGTP